MAHLVCMVPVISQEIAQAPVKSKSLALVAPVLASPLLSPLHLAGARKTLHRARLFRGILGTHHAFNLSATLEDTLFLRGTLPVHLSATRFPSSGPMAEDVKN